MGTACARRCEILPEDLTIIEQKDWKSTKFVHVSSTTALSTLIVPVSRMWVSAVACSLTVHTTPNILIEFSVPRTLWLDWNEWIQTLASEADDITLLHSQEYLCHLVGKFIDGQYICSPRRWKVEISNDNSSCLMIVAVA